MLNRLQRGDTIIEVLLAFAVFSLLSVSCMVVMGQGTNAAQRALEITLVREQIDAQAESLRAAQQAFVQADSSVDTEWEKITEDKNNDSQHFVATTDCPKDKDEVQRSFIMDPRTATIVPKTTAWLKDINATGPPTPPAYAKLSLTTSPVTSYGIWIERNYKASANASLPGSYDFDIRACWYGAGLSVPLQIETSVRLYEPAS